MLKKAQMDFNPIAVLLAIAGGIFAWIMAGRMEATFFWKLITTLAVTGVGYVIANYMANQ